MEKFKLQALWPLKGWFEFTATGRDAVQVEAGGDENPHRLRKRRRERWKFVGKIRKPWRNVLDVHCFVKHSSLQVCFLANPSFNDYKYFLEYGSTSTLQLTLQDPTNSRNDFHDFWRSMDFRSCCSIPKKRISFNTESRHHDNISAWPGAGSGSGFGDYVGPRLLFFCVAEVVVVRACNHECGHVEDWWPGLESKCGCNAWLHEHHWCCRSDRKPVLEGGSYQAWMLTGKISWEVVWSGLMFYNYCDNLQLLITFMACLLNFWATGGLPHPRMGWGMCG